MRTQDLTHQGTKITVLRQFKGNNWLVVQGDSYYGKGLDENYKEFTEYTDAIDYFNNIKV